MTRDLLQSDAQVEADSLRTQLSKREQDLGRLRGERDDLMGRLAEKKARESVKVRHADEMEALVRSAEARMAALKSDVARLKARLAAEAGSEPLFTFLLREVGAGPDISADYVRGLETNLAEAEARVGALTGQVTALSADPALLSRLDSDSKARQELAVLQIKVAAFEKVLGTEPSLADDSVALVRRLQDKQVELETMERKLRENEMVRLRPARFRCSQWPSRLTKSLLSRCARRLTRCTPKWSGSREPGRRLARTRRRRSST